MPRKKPTTKTGKKAKMGKVMDEFMGGKLRSGSKKGAPVKGRKQAIAIGLNESGQSKKSAKAKPAAKKRGGGDFVANFEKKHGNRPVDE